MGVHDMQSGAKHNLLFLALQTRNINIDVNWMAFGPTCQPVSVACKQGATDNNTKHMLRSKTRLLTMSVRVKGKLAA